MPKVTTKKDVTTDLAPEDIAGYVTVHNQFVPQGEEVVVPALGSVANGSTKALDVSQVETFKSMGFEWPDNNDLVITISDDAPVAPKPETVVVPEGGTE
jgi:hypothetical protein